MTRPPPMSDNTIAAYNRSDLFNHPRRLMVMAASAAEPIPCRAMTPAHQGRRVRIARPPRGLDFNDVLLSRISYREDAA
jgi:hypothetical protein